MRWWWQPRNSREPYRQRAYDPADEPAPLDDAFRRGEAAHRLLNDPTLAEAFADIRADAWKKFLETLPGDTAKREELYRIVQAVGMLRAKLIAYRGDARIRAAARAANDGSDRPIAAAANRD